MFAFNPKDATGMPGENAEGLEGVWHFNKLFVQTKTSILFVSTWHAFGGERISTSVVVGGCGVVV